ncbi:MAG TPA: tRNA lysidine(34) synthetase TilS, partial [Gemmatimonadota bacterium]|nr:tRNA lysidine(34) synthetase TilS [Gemmatimonadota bacterium]
MGGRPELLPRGGRVVVALSGGPDSTALLHLLLGVAGELDLSLVAAHFDHGLRSESAAEAERVRARSRALGVPCRVDRAASELEPRQETFREARYRFLRRVARDVGAGRIATGHQADDQAETVLFRVLRGTGLRGLGGIPARRGSIVRPLLPFWKEEIVAFLEARGLEWLEDPSNRDPRWERARLRTRVLPALEEAWGRPVRGRLVDLARAARRADRALDAAAREALEAARSADDGAWDEASVSLSL